MRADSDGAPTGPSEKPASAPGASEEEKIADLEPEYIKEYPECPMAFDQMIITIIQYFDLVNLTSTKLEDLWLNLLEVLCLERPNKYTVFKAVHHQGFRNVILKDPLIKQIIHEVEEWKDSGLCHANPKKYLE